MASANSDDEMEVSAEEGNKLINEEFKVWKKNAPFLYDVVITHALQWPTLTCQWFPDKETPSNKPYATHRILLGTHTSGQSQDYLQIANVQLPKREAFTKADEAEMEREYNEERGEIGSHSVSQRLTVSQRINHSGEVNRARYMPQNPDLIATKSVSGNTLVFDRTKHSSTPERDGVCRPDITLAGQGKEGFGLAWNPTKMGHILSSSEDMTVCHWDITAYSKENSTMEPLAVYKGHSSIVGDVAWHATQENIFGSVGDDKFLMIWDARSPSRTSPQHRIEAHEKEAMAVAFSPADPHLIITGGADKTIVLHDMRAPGQKLHTFYAHTDEVMHLAWSPHSPSVFASGSSDRRINIWDLSQIGAEQTPDDAEDGAPELLFVHGGHTARITDLGWAPGEGDKWHLVSSAEDNVIMVWSPTWRIWAGQEVGVEDGELEREASTSSVAL